MEMREKMNIKVFAILLLILLQAACSATGPRYSELPKIDLNEKSEFIIFREKKLGAAGSKYCIKIDGEPLGILSSGGFLRTTITPGNHEIEIPSILRREPPTILTVDALEGESIYLLHSIDLASMWILPIGQITAIDASWDKKLSVVPEALWNEQNNKVREAKYVSECPK